MLEFQQFAFSCSKLLCSNSNQEKASSLGDSSGKCCAREQQGRSIAAVVLGALNFPDSIFHRRSQALGRLQQCQCWARGIVPVSFYSLLKEVRRSAVYHPKPCCQSLADLADRAGKLEKMQPLCHRHCRHISIKSSQNILTVSRACALDHNFKTLVKSSSEWIAFTLQIECRQPKTELMDTLLDDRGYCLRCF